MTRSKSLEISTSGLSDDKRFYSDAWSSDITWTVKVDDVLFDQCSEFQRVQVVSTNALGRMLILDGNIQCSERDEAAYHEMIVHPGLCRKALRPDTNGIRALVIGGGDGGAAREILRHRDVAQVEIIDIDAMVTDVAREFLPNVFQGADGRPLDDDPRLQIRHEDGVAFLQKTEASYDLVVVDASDPIGPGTALYTPAFYRSIRERLNPGGAVCVQGGSFWYLPDVFRTVFAGLSEVFPTVMPYQCFTAVYPGGVWNLQMATLGDDPLDVDTERAARLQGCRWYSTGEHRSAFSLPPYARDILRTPPPSLSTVSAHLEGLST